MFIKGDLSSIYINSYKKLSLDYVKDYYFDNPSILFFVLFYNVITF